MPYLEAAVLATMPYKDLVGPNYRKCRSNSFEHVTSNGSKLHAHCNDCFTFHHCDKNPACPFMECPNLCYARLHLCKLDDHLEHICPRARVSCPNASYGCPIRLVRKSISNHLAMCPASVVICTVERNRKLLDRVSSRKIKDPEKGRPNMDNLDRSALDLCLALNDQQLINDSFKFPAKLLKRQTNSLSKYHPVLPLLNECSSPLSNGLSRNGRPVQSGRLFAAQSTSTEDESFADEEDEMVEIPAVSTECVKCRLDPGSQHLHVVGSVPGTSFIIRGPKRKLSAEKNSYTNPGRNLLVDLCLDFLSQSYSKRRDYYTIRCDHVTKRQEFVWHYENYHADVVCNLNSWLITRCPMNHQGCQYYHYRMTPAGSAASKVIFSPDIGSFMVNNSSKAVNVNDQTNFGQWETLPHNVWMKIFLFCDSLTLYSMSLVSTRLRSVCKLVLPRKGIVEVVWAKEQTGCGKLDSSKYTQVQTRSMWHQKTKRWSFSKCFEPIKRWAFADVGKFCNHIQNCAFYDPVQYAPGERVPVMKFLTYDDLATQNVIMYAADRPTLKKQADLETSV